MSARILILLLISFLSCSKSFAEPVRVAVASNFQKTAKALVKLYAEQSEDEVSLSFGSSGKIFAQIAHGAPYDIFLSADTQKPFALVEAGKASDENVFTYAMGQLVLWGNENRLKRPVKEVLMSRKFNKIALANPKLAPYGMAAAEVLRTLNLTDQLKSKIVLGENISQTYQFIASGNAELGFVALSQIIDQIGTKNVNYWKVAMDLYQPIQQNAVLLDRAEQKASAKRFFQFLKSQPAKQLIASHGYLINDCF